MKSILLHAALYVSLVFNTFYSLSQSVIRGPYLQSVTHESIKIMWRTTVNTDSKVWYGTDPNNLSLTVEITDNLRDHIVEIEGLQPTTTYFYMVGSSSGPLATDIVNQHFKTHPIPGTPVPVRIWATGDFGRGNIGQIETKQAFFDWTGSRKTDVWLWLGDNAYQDGTDAEYQSKVFGLSGFSDIFPYIPFWPSPGNHDYNTVWSESTLLGIPYQNIPFSQHEGPYFDMVEVPKYGEAGGYPSMHEVFYSFDYGDVHFLSLNSEVFDYTLTYNGINQMKNWIENDLQQNTRKFTIAYFHQPPYSKGSHDSDDLYELVMKAMRERVIPLLEEYDVDLVVCGHSHVFERSRLIKGHYGNSGSFNALTMDLANGSNGNYAEGNAYIKDGSYATPEGTVYVVCGNSGSQESSPSLNYPAMIYSHGGSNAMGSFVIDVDRNRLDGKYLKTTGEIGDHFTILKKDLELTPIANQTICEGQSVQVSALYSGGSHDITYLWSVNNLTDSTITLSPITTTQYVLTVTDLLTGQVETVNFTINVNTLADPMITEPIPGTLAASPSNLSYQWFINGNPISGATGQYYQPLFNGMYSVTVTNASGCSKTSGVFNYLGNTSSIDELKSNELGLFPNPAGSQITLTLPSGLQATEYIIEDISGKKLLKAKINPEYNTTIDLTGLSAGIYFITVSDPRKELFKRSFSKQ